MAHTIDARLAKYYDDGCQGKPYCGRMRKVSVPATSDLRVWDGSTIEVDEPVNQPGHEAWLMGINGHRAKDHNGGKLSDIELLGVRPCCQK